jgi:hypothetical protein
MGNKQKRLIWSVVLLVFNVTAYGAGIPKLSKSNIQLALSCLVATEVRSFASSKPLKQGELIEFAHQAFKSGFVPRKYMAKDLLLKAGSEGGPYDVEIEKKKVEDFIWDILGVKLTVWAYTTTSERWGLVENSSIMPYKFRKAEIASIKPIGKDIVDVAFRVRESGQEPVHGALPIVGHGTCSYIWRSNRWIMDSFKMAVASRQ